MSTNKLTKALQNLGLVAKPTMAQLVTQTVADATHNATMAVGEIGMAGVRGVGRKTATVGRRVGKSKAAADTRSVAAKARGAAGPLVTTAASATAVGLLSQVMSAGARRAWSTATSPAVTEAVKATTPKARAARAAAHKAA